MWHIYKNSIIQIKKVVFFFSHTTNKPNKKPVAIHGIHGIPGLPGYEQAWWRI